MQRRRVFLENLIPRSQEAQQISFRRNHWLDVLDDVLGNPSHSEAAIPKIDILILRSSALIRDYVNTIELA